MLIKKCNIIIQSVKTETKTYFSEKMQILKNMAVNTRLLWKMLTHTSLRL